LKVFPNSVTSYRKIESQEHKVFDFFLEVSVLGFYIEGLSQEYNFFELLVESFNFWIKGLVILYMK
jgi:hypothetical protein